MLNFIKQGMVAALLVTSTAVKAQTYVSLEDCREQAVAYNKDLKKAALQIAEAESNLKVAKKAYLPSIEASATAMHIPNLNAELNMPGGFLPTAESLEAAQAGNFSGMSDVYSPGMSMTMDKMSLVAADVSLIQPIYTGGKINAINKQAKIGQEISQENYQLTYSDIIVKTDQAYWNVIAARDGVALSKSYLEMLTDLEEQMADMQEVGLLPASEKLRVSVQKNQAELNVVKAENGLTLATMFLNQLMGAKLKQETVPTDELNATVAKMDLNDGLTYGLSNRQELKMMDKQVEISKLQEQVVRADYLPQAGVSAAYMYAYATDVAEDLAPIALLSGQVNIPVFHWGERKQKMRVAKLQTEQHQTDYEQAFDMITLEIQQKSLALEEAYTAIQIAKKGVAQAKEAMEETQYSFEADLNTTTDLLNAKAEYQNAQYQLIGALIDYETQKTDWAKTTGTLVRPMDNK
ncbi:TolC family protein [Persicobacter sp. CCB-QB2]|uniref:TolC family protein n=1 Tax=Persicobacter sp. CCB-QB2 TaxID=1561025 RepID=UPI0006A9CDDB|nr:TolC family protein [Persicobacter sp. CCB-QB2]